jgi:CheY-like chemotaxis protein
MCSRPTVLVVEDEPIIREIMHAILEEEGFHAVSAECVSDAIETLSHEDVVDIVFADIDLGDRGGGYEVARQARRQRPGVKIVYTSGGAREDFQHQRVENARFVPKPYVPTDVCVMLRRELAN